MLVKLKMQDVNLSSDLKVCKSCSVKISKLPKEQSIVGYADDLDIMGRSLQSVEEEYNQLERTAVKIGLKVNVDKTKRMVQSRGRPEIPPILASKTGMGWSHTQDGWDDHRVPKRKLEGRIYGVRPKGRPKNRWIDSVNEDPRVLLETAAWRRAAKDREEWRKRIDRPRLDCGLWCHSSRRIY
ncbi:hypothetical protein ANN_22705 [Periplaneta americana]|uniref:Reverse transcriptase domain-containing protein n=1 Tax=Periplaneta americana TaxID=6978 RepID=A0ABQ8S9E7_PERAM|nr:hypothetical protein ANN_22705 [Periplaneta americana]